jgi:hypothetical protein
MNEHLKVRMLDAALVADKLWQHNIAKAITDGVAEIERLLGVLAEVGAVQKRTVDSMQAVLPFLRRLENPTPEMLAAMSCKTPYFVCLAEEGAWQVRHTVEPAQDVIVSEYNLKRDAVQRLSEMESEYHYSEMLRVAAGQPLLLQENQHDRHQV